MSDVNAYQESKNQISALMIELNEARKAEKDVLLYDRRTVDFLEDGESRNVGRHQDHMEEVYTILDRLTEDEIVNTLDLGGSLEKIKRSARGYQATFEELIRQMVRRGFKDHGLEGEMREYVHNLQDCDSDAEKVFAFQLRRHEKDFFMRLDDKYVTRLHQTVDDFLDFLHKGSMPHMTPEYLYRVTNGVQAYRNHFDKIVKADRNIGLTDDDGLRGKLKDQASVVEPQIEFVYEAINAQTTKLQRDALLVMIVSFSLLLIGGVVMSLVLSGAISRPIILLDKVIRSILAGKEDAENELDGIDQRDEIGSLMKNFRFMLANLRQNMTLVQEKNAKLEKAKEADKKRNWSMEGLALFGEILKNPDDLAMIGSEVIGNLVKYLKASQGAIFVAGDTEDGEPPYMEMVACYAWKRHKKAGQKVGYGDGLIGTVWRDQETLYHTDIPGDYIRIQSGLGGAQPTALLIVPIKTQNNVIGVIEVASLFGLLPYEIEFVERLAERIATTLSAVKLQERTRILLKESQQMTEELQANEEEMRQNMEELQATQEEMHRSTAELNHSLGAVQLFYDIHKDIVNKVYDGVIISNDRFLVKYVNDYILRKLSFDQTELLDCSVNQLFTEDMSRLVQDMEYDPTYILNHFSDAQTVEIHDKLGHVIKVDLVVTKLQCNGETYFAFLFQKSNVAADSANEYLAHLMQKTGTSDERERATVR